MACEKIQPWRAHYTPRPGNTDVVTYQEAKGAEIIADGGSAGPPVDDSRLISETKTQPIPKANRLCPHLKPITNPTLR